jgi:hypothetical protein
MFEILKKYTSYYELVCVPTSFNGIFPIDALNFLHFMVAELGHAH